ncbi:hypothetical protein CTI12_AA603240 [Artemisia annua]|uniref:Uncharacterized protein n=1 Tax=Artemisia annua TaxID=35608 RepID=A0A2U1KHB4_ARTAN|nr:hypothetical protein CTI12_AA603240 [Artemisia annua]
MFEDDGTTRTERLNHIGFGILAEEWEMCAIRGSGNSTINSQGDWCTAPVNSDTKEALKRPETAQRH